LKETVKQYSLGPYMRFNSKVVSAAWDSKTSKWTLTVRKTDGEKPTEHQLTTRFLHMCTGYYNSEEGYNPKFSGEEEFAGRIVHPQKWTADVEYANKHVVIIGSGATAVTLLPNIAEKAASTTMLQRSPSYVLALPQYSTFVNLAQKLLPEKWAYSLIRWRNVIIGKLLFQFCVYFPGLARKLITRGMMLGLKDSCDVNVHFNPRYNPWEERLCLCPDGDFFKAIRAGKATVVTGEIDRFVRDGILLKNGTELKADLIIKALGLNVLGLGGMNITIDGQPVNYASKVVYRSFMFNDLPNFFLTSGYTNASWTLKCDLTSALVARMINLVDSKNAKSCCPRLRDPTMELLSAVPLKSGYIQRSLHLLPKQGSKGPWRVYQNYVVDYISTGFCNLADEYVEFK